MAKIKVNRVTNANVYVDGVNLLGRAEEVTPPSINQMMADHTGLGMVAKIKVPTGGLELTDATFKWASFYSEVIRKAALASQALQLQVRASIDEYSGEGRIGETGLLISLSGMFHELSLGTFKKHEAVTQDMKFTAYYMNVVADGESLVEVDVFNNIYKVAGEDLLARFRSLIGG
ncbi:MAG: phage major tail tube protein [Gemmatimonadaceae bacterium]